MAEQVSPDATAALHVLRDRGAQRIDPVRFRLVESMLKRAAAHQGAARQVLDDKLATVLQALSEAVVLAEGKPGGAVGLNDEGRPKQGPLAGLVAHIARQKPGAAQTIVPINSTPSTKAKHDSPVDPSTLHFFRRTWSRLSADQRLAQSRSSLPENAGPLNSQHLVHRSLNVMRELSPEYFDLFISHVDTLLCLERANEQAAREVGLPPRAKGGKKATGAKRG